MQYLLASVTHLITVMFKTDFHIRDQIYYTIKESASRVEVFKGGYHAQVQKQKMVFLQGGARTTLAMFRVSKTTKIKKKDMIFRLIKTMRYGYAFHLSLTWD